MATRTKKHVNNPEQADTPLEAIRNERQNETREAPEHEDRTEVFPYHRHIAKTVNILLLLSVGFLIFYSIFKPELPYTQVAIEPEPPVADPTTPPDFSVDVIDTQEDPEYVLIPGEDITIIPEEKGCVVTGCSGQICSDREIASTCEVIDAYACYQLTRCELQRDGTCGWTENREFRECLLDPPPIQ